MIYSQCTQSIKKKKKAGVWTHRFQSQSWACDPDPGLMGQSPRDAPTDSSIDALRSHALWPAYEPM